MDKNVEDLKLIAAKSADLVQRQIEAYRHRHSNAATVITIVAVFVPLFLGGIDLSSTKVLLWALVPLLILVTAICILLFGVLRTASLDHGLGFHRLTDMVNWRSEERILLFEIGANRSSFFDNQGVLDRATRKYNLAILCTIIGILSSSIVLVMSQWIKPAEVNEVRLIGPVQLESSQLKSYIHHVIQDQMSKDEPVREVPDVPPADRTRISEGVDPKRPAPPSPNQPQKPEKKE